MRTSNKRGSQVKLDFMRSWEHSRSRKKAVSIEQLAEDAEENSIDFDIPDTRSEFENSVLSELQIAEFAARFSGRDKKILEMKMEGHTAQEIAEAVGYKTHGAVLKRIRHIAAVMRILSRKNIKNIWKHSNPSIPSAAILTIAAFFYPFPDRGDFCGERII